MTATTRDALDGGALVLEQPARGYRFNVDSVWLADFVGPCRGTVFDLGAGVGTIGLLLACRGHAHDVVLVERDPILAAIAARNVASSGLPARLVEGDVSDVAPRAAGQASVVVCNPPYFRPDAGRPARSDRREARSGDVATFVRAARAVMGARGRACFVYPTREWISLAIALRASGLEPKRVRHVHSAPNAPARVVLVECRAGRPGGLVVEPPRYEAWSGERAEGRRGDDPA